ncbi:HSP20-like chaperone [Emericellopsis atlantica]|uniref:HSP20-like chaperone n=1 Tax=Emericellopsis atlantica TaxID=2614577 RepID=A0A9P8CSN1_9HYPO|nr:HSP20-like chaperone [Emericellopsis atlantica]KAG9257998.1 HSP20-like chaperone [Emericellopsis atlantica]
MSSQANNNNDNANNGIRPPRPEDFFASFFPGLNPPTGSGVDHRGNDFFTHLAGAFHPPPPPPHAGPWGGPTFSGDFDDWNPWLHHGPPRHPRRGGGPHRHRQGHGHGPGPRGHHARDEQQQPRDAAPANEDVPDPAEVTPDEDSPSSSPGGARQCPRREQQFNPWANAAQRVSEALKNHLQNYNNAASSYTTNNGPKNADNDVDCFTPPMDLFDAVTTYTLHISLPGAKKEDVGISFDPETAKLSISGVIHRPGDEEFQKTLVGKGERTVGMFKREVELKDEVDAAGITAKMEDGILIVTVPKVEKGWTEIHKIEIE